MYSDNFMEKIYTKITIDDNDCWIWTGTINNSGYGVIWYKNKMHPVYRIMYEHDYNLSIPTNLHVHHAICFEKRCIRPDHLAVVSAQSNSLLKPQYIEKRRQRLQKLQDCPSILTTTELADILTIKPTNVLKYMRSIAMVYDDFDFCILKKGKGPKPSTLKLVFEPGFFERLAEPEKDWRNQPAFSPLDYPVALAV